MNMLTSDKRPIVTDLGEKLLHLYVLRAEACSQEDWHRMRTLEAEIEHATADRDAILLGRMAEAV
jgi:hypothetical protein